MANSGDPDKLKPTDLDLLCLQRQDISGFSRTRVKEHEELRNTNILGQYSSRKRLMTYTAAFVFFRRKIRQSTRRAAEVQEKSRTIPIRSAGVSCCEKALHGHIFM